jgi:hypothetical protein
LDQRRRAAWNVAGLAHRPCVARFHQPAHAGRSPDAALTLAARQCWPAASRWAAVPKQTRGAAPGRREAQPRAGERGALAPWWTRDRQIPPSIRSAHRTRHSAQRALVVSRAVLEARRIRGGSPAVAAGLDQRRRAAWDVVGLANRPRVARFHQPADAGRSPTLACGQPVGRSPKADAGLRPRQTWGAAPGERGALAPWWTRDRQIPPSIHAAHRTRHCAHRALVVSRGGIEARRSPGE